MAISNPTGQVTELVSSNEDGHKVEISQPIRSPGAGRLLSWPKKHRVTGGGAAQQANHEKEAV